jgi:hypothetical protein
VLRIFIALKNPLLSAGFELSNLVSGAKHDNHYANSKDKDKYKQGLFHWRIRQFLQAYAEILREVRLLSLLSKFFPANY